MTAEAHDTDTQTGVSDRVARVYAEALLNAAVKRHQADEVADQLDSLIDDLFRSTPQLEAFLASAAVKRDAKEAAIRKALEGKASDLFLDFLLVLNKHDRLGVLPGLRGEFRKLRDLLAKRMRVRVRTAFELADDQRERLVAQLRDEFQMEPVLEVRTDPDLLGGMVLQIGDWVFDGSVRSRLKRMRDHLLARVSHGIQV